MSWKQRALLAGLIATACQSSAPPLAPPAEISIELFGGAAQREPLPEPSPERIEVLLDVTPSASPEPTGVEPWAAARSAAGRFVRGVPDTTALRVHALGLTPGRSCEPARRLDPRERAPSHAALAAQIETLTPAGEGSLAVALAELLGVLARDGASERSRVLVFSDLGSECGGDLCTAAALLLEAGVRLDFVVLGAAEPPACFAEPVPAVPSPPAPVLATPAYRILAYDPNGGPEPLELAEGRADGARRAVPAGAVTIELGFDPPVSIGPLVLSPGAWTRVRVVAFPGLDPPVREWTAAVERLAASGDSE
jgi:hypothetical protein